MVDFTRKESVADLTARLQTEGSPRARTGVLISLMAQRFRVFADRVGDMKADNIKQADLDALKRDLDDAANELNAGGQALGDAMVSYSGTTGTNLDSGPGQGQGANLDPDLGGPKGGPGQFAGNTGGPRGSDNPPDQPRRDQLGDATPGRVQPNPANPVPLPPGGKPRPLAGTTPEERAAAEGGSAVADQSTDQRNEAKPDRETQSRAEQGRRAGR